MTAIRFMELGNLEDIASLITLSSGSIPKLIEIGGLSW
jgi:hypothetical protein